MINYKKILFYPNNTTHCTITGDVRENVITYHIDAGDGELIVTKEHLIYGLECELPSDIDLESEFDEPEDDGTIMEVTIKIKKYLTKAEVEALPEKS